MQHSNKYSPMEYSLTVIYVYLIKIYTYILEGENLKLKIKKLVIVKSITTSRIIT